ncbi:DUF6338 family protein [Methylomonas sp. HW2-6]|uniref:DUF6338 family protein n=1 Tax=Methylomonas sp. HW2-6 TaxID=3376687 RepID=UPI0040436C7F
MPELEKEAIALLVFLLPGFVSAWVLYGLTSQVKPSQFERIIQALIFTFVVQALIPPAKSALCFFGKFVQLGVWDQSAENFVRLVIAIIIGVLLAYYINTDSFHKKLRRVGFTTRTSFPSEWVGVFSEHIAYIVLHFKDGRRLYGWPKEWPTQYDKGHFYIMQPIWLGDDGSTIELKNVDGILVNVADIKWVEFMNNIDGEVT